MTEDPGVLGNLPRSRPGRRSDKRGGAWSEAAGSGAAAGGASEAPRTQARARKTTSAAKPRAAAAKTRPERSRPAPQQTGGDPLSGAVRLAGGLAEAYVKTTAKIAGGVLKRLPRP
jgi:hypothetical protein